MSNRTTAVSLTANVNGYLSGLNQAERATQKLGKAAAEAKAKLAEQHQAMTQAGAGLLAVGAVAVASSVLAAKAAVGWETAWAGVTKTVDGTPEQLARVEEGLRALSKELPASHDEIAAVAEAAGQLGIQTGSVVAFTKTMIDLGETTNLSANEAATSLARFMNVMGTSQDKVSNLGSALVELGNNYATTEAEILEMSMRLSGAGRQIGLSEGEVLGLATALSSVGIEAEAGGSAISKVMIDIASSVDKGGERVVRFADIAGVSADAFTKKWKTDPGAALALFVKGLADAESQGGSTLGILEELGITEVRMRDALLRSAAASDQFTEAMGTGNKAIDENNALTAEAEKRYATAAAKIDMAKNAVVDAAIGFGEVFLPAISSAAEGVADFADFMARLPDPIKGTVAAMTGLGGAAALTGGLFLLAVPKIAEFRLALATLSTSSIPAVASAAVGMQTAIGKGTAALSAMAKFLMGPWGVAIAAAAVGLKLLSDYLDSVQATSAEVTNSLVTAKTAAEMFETIMKGKDQKYFGTMRRDLSDLSSVLEISARQSTNWWERIFNGGNFAAEDALKELGKELASLAQTDLPAAQRAFTLMAEETNGSERELWRLLSTMPDYRDALIEQATNQGIQIEGLSEAEKKTALLKIATDEGTVAEKKAAEQKLLVAEATDEVIRANEEWLAGMADANASFIDFGGGLDTLIQKNKDHAQATADSTANASDSWEDYYDGFSFSLAEYLAELQSQVDAQENWEQNMVLLSGRASQTMLDELARLGPEGAPLVAQLVTASDEELAKMEGIYAEKAADATGAFAQKLHDSKLVISAAAGQLGQVSADEIAAKLAAGTHTVEQIVAEYGLRISGMNPVVRVDTSQAERKLANLRSSAAAFANSGMSVTAYVREVGGRAAGGAIRGPGGPRDDKAGLYRLSNGGQPGYAQPQYASPQYASAGPSVQHSTTVQRVTEVLNLQVEGRTLAQTIREYDRSLK